MDYKDFVYDMAEKNKLPSTITSKANNNKSHGYETKSSFDSEPEVEVSEHDKMIETAKNGKNRKESKAEKTFHSSDLESEDEKPRKKKIAKPNRTRKQKKKSKSENKSLFFNSESEGNQKRMKCRNLKGQKQIAISQSPTRNPKIMEKNSRIYFIYKKKMNDKTSGNSLKWIEIVLCSWIDLVDF